jgi:hypothetical protein
MKWCLARSPAFQLWSNASVDAFHDLISLPDALTSGVVEWAQRQDCTHHLVIYQDLEAVCFQETRCHSIGVFDHR